MKDPGQDQLVWISWSELDCYPANDITPNNPARLSSFEIGQIPFTSNFQPIAGRSCLAGPGSDDAAVLPDELAINLFRWLKAHPLPPVDDDCDVVWIHSAIAQEVGIKPDTTTDQVFDVFFELLPATRILLLDDGDWYDEINVLKCYCHRSAPCVKDMLEHMQDFRQITWAGDHLGDVFVFVCVWNFVDHVLVLAAYAALGLFEHIFSSELTVTSRTIIRSLVEQMRMS